MAKSKSSRSTDSTTSILDEPFGVEPPVPQYAAPPAEISDDSAFDDLKEACKNASYNLLDQRDGRWCLLTFGSGANLRSFNSFEEGVEFIQDVGISNVRCLHVPEGFIS